MFWNILPLPWAGCPMAGGARGLGQGLGRGAQGHHAQRAGEELGGGLVEAFPEIISNRI